jgi:hypothetical protein
VCDGTNVGSSVGVVDGRGVGTSVGHDVGASVGSSVVGGIVVGTSVGVSEGRGVGTAVGTDDGMGVGTAVGERVGTCVGTKVGVCVGAAVGDGVANVAAHMSRNPRKFPAAVWDMPAKVHDTMNLLKASRQALLHLGRPPSEVKAMKLPQNCCTFEAAWSSFTQLAIAIDETWE